MNDEVEGRTDVSAGPHSPSVSVVIPMLNEIDHIGRAIEAFDRQDYPADRFQVVIADGGSTDGSRELVERCRSTRPWLTIVDNPDRRAASGFNRGLEASRSEIVCIVGAHAEVGPDFISRSVKALEETGAAGVGGRLLHVGTTPQGTAIGLAMTSPFGMASPFRYGTTRREVDTIGHPAYRRAVIDEVGPFDETLERNSDYELNHRIRAAGHRLVLEPDILTLYRPRASLRALARQFRDYGHAKAGVVRRHPSSVRARHMVPPLLVAMLLASPALLPTRAGRTALSLSGAGYAAVLVAAWVDSRPSRQNADPATFLAAFPVMHVAWGWGFLAGVAGGAR